jgi:hypothetical protein
MNPHYTVSRTTQNESLLWKITDLGIENKTFSPSPILVFDI